MHFGSFFYLISTAHSASLPGLSPGAHLHDTYVRGEAYSYRLKNFVGENVFYVFTYYFFSNFLNQLQGKWQNGSFNCWRSLFSYY
jgi:hypothetical protein